MVTVFTCARIYLLVLNVNVIMVTNLPTTADPAKVRTISLKFIVNNLSYFLTLYSLLDIGALGNVLS